MEASIPLPYSLITWQPRSSTWLVTVVVKATFSLEQGELKLAPSQEPILEHDSYWDDDGKRSLSSASDLAPSKLKADVLVLGHAFSPPGKPVRSLIARLAIESIDKSIELVADRAVGPDGTVYQGPRFNRIPIVYERAAGGAGTWNPVGIDPKNRDRLGRAPLPNITPVGRGEDTMNSIDPIGFGPVAPGWPLRESKLGYHRNAVASGAFLEEPLPEGFDLGFFNVAPIDQQLDSIPESANIRLESLHPQHPVLEAKLPGIRPRVTVDKRGHKERPKMRPDTLLIDTDRALVTLTWRGHFAVEQKGERYGIAVEVETPRQSWRTVEHAIGARQLEALAEKTSAGIEEAALERRSARTVDARSSASSALPFQGNMQRSRDPLKTSSPGLPFVGSSPSTANLPPSVSETATMLQAVGTPTPPNLPPIPAGMPPLPAPGPPPPLPSISTGLPFGTEAPPRSTPDPSASWQGAYPTAASLGVRAPTFGAQPRVDRPVPPPPPPSSPGLAPPPLAPPPLPPPASVATPPSSSTPFSAVKPPAPVMMHASTAALAGLVSASNAAADPRTQGQPPARAPRKIEGDVLQLLWWSTEVAPKIRRKPEWKKILADLEQGPFDPDVDEPALADDPGEMEDRREVYEVIARGAPSSQDGLDSALLDAIRSDGRFAPQLLLLVGEVRFDFDEIEQLKANVSAATPFAPNDENLKKTLEGATGFLSTPGLVASPDVAASMTQRIREAFEGANRPVAATYLDDQTERALLERRAYQKRDVFGEPHLRSLFYFAGSSTGIPTYFPEAVAKKLPLFRRLRTRLIVEGQFQADQYESHSAALKVAAIARIVR